MTRFALLVLGAALLMTVDAAAKGPLAPRTVFGLVSQNRQTTVAELNALTLKPVSKSVLLGASARYLGRSPGGGGRGAFVTGTRGDRMVFVDLDKMKREGAVALPCAITDAITWETADRLVTTCGGSASSVLVVNPVTRKLRSRTPLRGSLVEMQATGGVLVGLLTPLDGIGPARLVVASSSGRVRTVALPGVEAGTEVLDKETYHVRSERPGLAVDRNGRRAAVVPASGPVVEIDLARLDVVAHALLARTPAAVSKQVDGTVRNAVWTWSNTIAVSGADGVPGGTDAWHAVPASVIDVDRWTSRTLDVAATVTTNGWSLLAWGSTWDGLTQTVTGHGLTGYTPDGNRRFHLFESEPVYVSAFVGSYAYVSSENSTRFKIVDVETGKVIGDVRMAKPTRLAAARPIY